MAISIGIVTGSMSRKAGGLFNSVRKSAIYLAGAGLQVDVYAHEDEFSSADLPQWKPLRPHVLPLRFRNCVPYSPELSERLMRADHDILHLHGIWQLHSRSVSRWRRAAGRPVMISPRGMLDEWALQNSRWKKRVIGAWFENRNLQEADCLHALNASEAGSMRSFGLTGPIATIPNATDLPDIASRVQSNSLRTLLFLGRIHPKKGLSELVDAWSIAFNMLKGEWHLAIAGWDDGGHLDTVRQQIRGRGVDKSISILGPVFGEEKDRLLRQADAFILPSFSEGLPMSVLEAWAYRLPVFMTRACNLPIGFESNAAVEIIPDPEVMAKSLVSRLLDPMLFKLGDNGRVLVEKHFSWPHVAAEHLAVYDWLVCGGDRPACVSI